MIKITFYKLPLALVFAVGALSLSACSGGSSGSSVYGGYGYPYYGSNFGYSSMYYGGYDDDWDRRERPDQSERLERRDNIREGASSRPAGSGAASRNMGRPSGGRMGGGRMGGGGRGGGGRR